MVIQPHQQVFVPVLIEREIEDITGTAGSLPAFEKDDACWCPRTKGNPRGVNTCPSNQPTRLTKNDYRRDDYSVPQNCDTEPSKQSKSNEQRAIFTYQIPRRRRSSTEQNFSRSSN